MDVTLCTPGSSAGAYPSTPVDFLYQSIIRPTKGEMRVAPASAHATAWTLLKIRVQLHVMPSASRILQAWMPSHVEAILMRMRDLSMPISLYMAMILRALATVASVSNERRASTSVE